MTNDKPRTNAHKCLLAANCRLANTADCNDFCPSYIAMGGRIKYANLPARYRLDTLANASPRKDQPDVYRKIDAYAATFERYFDEDATADRPVKSVYLWSASPGTGKTTTAAALLNEWIRVSYLGALKRGKQPSKAPALFLDINEWQSAYNLATMTNDEDGLGAVKRMITKAQAVDFLVIDDVGIRKASEAFKGYVHAIVNARCVSGKPTVYTSNVPLTEKTAASKRVEALKPYDIADVFDARIADRVRDLSVVLEFGGTSKRGR